MLFLGEKRAEVKKNNPDFKLMDITKVGSYRVIDLTGFKRGELFKVGS